LHDRPAGGHAVAQHTGVDQAGVDSVRFRGVTIEFALARGGRYPAVAATDLSIGAHEFVAIVGPTGCGKSTLLNVAAGLLAPSSGEIRVLGAPLAGVNTAAGYLFQQDAVMPWKTARDNVAIGLEVAGVAREQALERAQAWLQRVGLRAFGERYPHQLSGGQRKRVGLAQVLIRNPKILLMDEPFGPLDAQTRQIMGNLLLELWAGDRKAVLFVTHDLEEAIALADKVVVMTAAPGTVKAVFDIDLPRPRGAVQEIRFGERFVELHHQIWESLRDEVTRAYARTASTPAASAAEGMLS
jgi:NitT/TauT family transport system ATP-binding protein